MPQPNVTDIASEIAQSGLPALVVDTCVSLDIIRCISRGNPRIVGIARQLIDAQLHGELLLYAHSALHKEALRNRAEVEGQAQKQAGYVDQEMAQYRKAAAYLGVGYPHAPSYSHESIIPPLVALHDEFLGACVHIALETQNQLAAFVRASNNRRPAKKGGGANDCLMLEEFCAIARAIPAAHPLVLFTTNTDDFVDKAQGPHALHHEIVGSLAGTKAQVSLSWEWAANIVLTHSRLRTI